MGLDVAFLDGVFDKICSFLEVQLFHHVGAMALHRVGADKKEIADLFVRFSFCDQL